MGPQLEFAGPRLALLQEVQGVASQMPSTQPLLIQPKITAATAGSVTSNRGSSLTSIEITGKPSLEMYLAIDPSPEKISRKTPVCVSLKSRETFLNILRKTIEPGRDLGPFILLPTLDHIPRVTRWFHSEPSVPTMGFEGTLGDRSERPVRNA